MEFLSLPALLQVYFYVDAGKFFWCAGQPSVLEFS